MDHVKIRRLVGLFTLTMFLVFGSGCDTITSLFGGGEKTSTAQVEQAAPDEQESDNQGKNKGKSESDVKKTEDEKWRYNPGDKMDPFVTPPPPELTLGDTTQDPYDLDQMLLTGVIRGAGKDRAFLLLPDGNDRIVKLNDPLGRMGGRVAEIGDDYIIVEETYIKPGPENITFVIRKKLEFQDEAKGRKKK